jgi:pSer/pThr/pTyr-binding forkhead associated (FHA) protein
MSALLLKNLGVVCPVCDFLNVVGAVRCMACGEATEADSSTTRPTSSPSRLGPAPSSPPPGLRVKSSPTPAPVQTRSPTPAPVSTRTPLPSSASNITSAVQKSQDSGPRLGFAVLAGPSKGQRFRLPVSGAQIGRSRGIILFPDDPFVSPLHASVYYQDGKLYLRDNGSTSGCFVSITGTETIAPNTTFSTGLRLFRYLGTFDPAPAWNRHDVTVYGAPLPNNVQHYGFEEILVGNRPGKCLLVSTPVLTIGQSKCDFNYPGDDGLAQKHCEVAPLPTGALIRDLSSGLGTYVRIGTDRILKAGDRVRIGLQTLQVELLG